MSTITSTITQSVTLGTGTYTSPVTITSVGAVEPTHAGDAGIYGPGTQIWAVFNYGTVRGANAGIGVNLAAGGTIVNGSVSDTNVLIAGGVGLGALSGSGSPGGLGSDGVDLAGGSLANFATITAGQGGAGGSGQTGPIDLGGKPGGTGGTGGAGIKLTGTGSISNAGTVAGGQGGTGGTGGGGGAVFNSGGPGGTGGQGGLGGAGITLTASGTIGNTGTIIGGQGGVGGAGGAGTGSFGSGAQGASGSAGVGILLSAGGYISNGSAGATTALISGLVGIQASGTASVTITNAGTISGSSSGTAIAFAGTGNNLLILEHGYAFSGGVSVAGTANRLELLGAAGAVTIDFNKRVFNGFVGFTYFGTLTFGAPSGNSEILKITDTTSLPGTISGFTAYHDIIDLTQISPTGIQTPTLNGSNQLIVSNGSQTVALQLDRENYSGVVWQAGTDGSGGTDISVACFCRGTMIETPAGEVAVEALAIADLVVTWSGETRPIKWIGRRSYDGRFIAGNKAVLPICVTAGGLTDGVPARDLWVSPEHALYLNDVLVPARHLVNGATIVQRAEVERVDYFHIELAAHDIIVADGAPAETYVDCDNRRMYQNVAEFAQLYPDDNRPGWQFCVRRLEETSSELAAIRAAVFARAEGLGHGLVSDPDLHLLVDGETVRGAAVEGRRHRFNLPAGSRGVWLASRIAVPAQVDPALQDWRPLGISLEKLVLSDATLRIEIGHDFAGLIDGFHADEGCHRWTDGLARVPAELLHCFTGTVMLDVYRIESALRYCCPPPNATRTAA